MNPPKTLAQWLIMVVILGALVAIGIAAARHFGIAIPQLVWTLLWIVLGAALIILAIRFLMSLGGWGEREPVMTFDLQNFLSTFGFLDYPDDTPDKVSIGRAQRLYGLPETGEADAMTLRTLANTPRCGLTDAFQQQATAVNKWGIFNLKWWVESYPVGLAPAAVDFEIKSSLGYWSEVTPFKFERTQDRYAAQLLITTAKGPPLFDGRGNVVERGEMPTSESHKNQLRLWLDADELWTTTATSNGQPLLRAFGHGFGHNLGLNHSEIYGMLMYPLLTARVYRPMEEDIEKIQALYGAKPTPGPVPTPAPQFVRSRVEAYNRIYEGNLPLTN